MYIKREIIELINDIVPKKNNRIMLRSAMRYPDNMQAILDELLRNNISKRMRIICVGNGFEAYDVEHYPNKSLRALLLFFTCKYVFYDSAIFYEPKCTKRQVTINVWHGSPLKTVGFCEHGSIHAYRTATYAIATSELFEKAMSKGFGVPVNNILSIGLPRNDYLFKRAEDTILNQLGIIQNDTYKYVMWMPTYRQSKFHEGDNEGETYEFGIPLLNSSNIESLHSVCKKNNIFLIIKWHGSQKLPKIFDQNYCNLNFLTTEDITKQSVPLYSVLARCDALITDYSSVYTDYLMLNRPICFAYEDYDKYKMDRGFMFDDIKSIMPGYHVDSMKGVEEFLIDISNNIDKTKNERESKLLLINKYYDANNSKRLCDYFFK